MPTAALVRLARNGPIIRHRLSEYIRGSTCWAASGTAGNAKRAISSGQASERTCDPFGEVGRWSDANASVAGIVARTRASGKALRANRASPAGSNRHEVDVTSPIPDPGPKPGGPEPVPRPAPIPPTPEMPPAPVIDLPPTLPSPGIPDEEPLPS